MTIDRTSTSLSASLPFHIAQAYGVPSVRPTKPVAPVALARPVAADEASVNGRLSSTGRRLIGGVVPGSVDFSGDQPAPSTSGNLSIYRHPADKNAAATGIRVGRSLDVQG